jgi:hypothetical protein
MIMTENPQFDILDRKIPDIITKNARIPYPEEPGSVEFKVLQLVW